ncbi:ABC transporter permease [Desulforamulus hydrothermalis]|uniref:Putative peptide transporter permease subunit: membrane component of ABC superfamily n=1 Tax=Desulforamulus hydrothermalis Lam5 = DSM 18033 TaxID=1121428 RepID=K8EKQ2_9FIRM|nr:ABC transporter permease [Desulforamulus hydrothermalis]CCO09126.1 putative peptide transporter permease subunit: membrane component of ABC superfamily [Desulforamulus hydrothermalis Lam5 = DSM 18033]SHH12073.1 peptide/nickel transport system permease protein [Desulforamulus hydrothermalis Lam5 = DSM 18033]
MLKYIVKRLILLVPVLFGISLFVFLVLRLFTADPASVMLGQHATAEQVAALREELGFNKPLYVQFGIFLGQILQGDFGRSLMTRAPVTDELLARFPATVELAMAAMLIATVIGVTVGVISAVKQYSAFDYLSMVGALLGVSMPIFWLGLMLIILFSVTLGWLPVSGRIAVGMEPASITDFYLLDSLLTGNWAAFKSALSHLVLPAVALASYSMAIIARMTRSTMLEVIRQDYIRTARSKGLAEGTVIFKHALRNALIPVTTVIGLQMGSLLGGAVLTETVFSWPGIGSFIVNAILAGDFPVVQGGVIMVATIFVVVNLIVDILYAYLDPRIKYS